MEEASFCFVAVLVSEKAVPKGNCIFTASPGRRRTGKFINHPKDIYVSAVKEEKVRCKREMMEKITKQ